jgi:hypothetical protein
MLPTSMVRRPCISLQHGGYWAACRLCWKRQRTRPGRTSLTALLWISLRLVPRTAPRLSPPRGGQRIRRGWRVLSTGPLALRRLASRSCANTGLQRTSLRVLRPCSPAAAGAAAAPVARQGGLLQSSKSLQRAHCRLTYELPFRTRRRTALQVEMEVVSRLAILRLGDQVAIRRRRQFRAAQAAADFRPVTRLRRTHSRVKAGSARAAPTMLHFAVRVTQRLQSHKVTGIHQMIAKAELLRTLRVLTECLIFLRLLGLPSMRIRSMVRSSRSHGSVLIFLVFLTRAVPFSIE